MLLGDECRLEYLLSVAGSQGAKDQLASLGCYVRDLRSSRRRLRTFGNIGRNPSAAAAGQFRLLRRQDDQPERAVSVQLRAEFFNFLNHPHFANPNTQGLGILPIQLPLVSFQYARRGGGEPGDWHWRAEEHPDRIEVPVLAESFIRTNTRRSLQSGVCLDRTAGRVYCLLRPIPFQITRPRLRLLLVNLPSFMTNFTFSRMRMFERIPRTAMMSAYFQLEEPRSFDLPRRSRRCSCGLDGLHRCHAVFTMNANWRALMPCGQTPHPCRTTFSRLRGRLREVAALNLTQVAVVLQKIRKHLVFLAAS